jgi:hypothetical protein
MNMNKRVGWIAVLGMATVASVAASASAKTIMAGMQEQPVAASPTGVGYTTSSGYGVFVQTRGYDSGGVEVCRGARSSFNGIYSTTTACTTASAVKFKMAVQTLIGNICSSPFTAWSGPIVACNTPSISLKRSDTGAFANRVIGGVGRGY